MKPGEPQDRPKAMAPALQGWVAAVVRVVLQLLIVLSFLAFILIQVFKPLIWFRSGTEWYAKAHNVSIKNHALFNKVSASFAKTGGYVLAYNPTLQVIWTLAPVWVAAVSAILLFELSKNSPKQRPARWLATLKAQMKRVLFFQLYPRRFWVWWCGGLNVLDLLLVLSWLAFNLMWSYFTVSPKYKSIRAQIATKKVTVYAGRLNMVNQTASSIGTATMFSLTLLFFPVPRNSFLHYVFNTDFSGLIKYHRWLGYGMAWTAFIHGLMYYIYWGVKGGFYANWKKWGNDHSNNLAGTIAIIFLLLIILTSMQFVRRAYFQVFIRCHVIGFVGFTIFTYIHYWQRWWYQTPGLVLLALDWTFRLAQWLHPSFVTGQFVTFDHSIITINLVWKKSARPQPGQFMFLNMPTGKRFQWHPVTVANVEPGKPGTMIVTAHMKCYGRWTTEMVGQMLERGKVMMRVDGPYGRPYGPGWHSHEALVIFAGGIGATPMLGMLRDLAAQRRRFQELGHRTADSSNPFPGKVHFHWACRGSSEFALLCNEILEASAEGWLDIHLYSTGYMARVNPLSNGGEGEELVKGYPAEGAQLVVLPQKRLLPIGNTEGSASSFFFKPGVLEAYGAGFYWIAAHTLAFLGAFFSLLMSAVYDNNLGMTGGNNKQNYKTAILVLVGTFVGSMGLPALLIFPYNLFRYKSKRTQVIRSDSSLDVGTDQKPEVLIQHSKVGSTEDGATIRIESGRPPIPQLLAAIAAQHSDLPSVGVFAAGPRSMTAEVKRACSETNDGWKSPYCDFSNHAFDL